MSKKNLTFEEVERAHGGQARAVWSQICEIGGWGTVSPAHSGGLDISGLDAKTRAEIEKLAGTPVPAVDALLKKSRAELEEVARENGFDGNAYTSKQELAQAILSKKEGK